MKKVFLILLSLTLLLCSCGGADETSAPSETVTESEAEAIPVLSEPVYVYERAVIDTLLPLDDFSWERELAPEIIMIHFTSAVVNHPDDPYNMSYIRQTFVDYELSIHYIIDRDGTVYSYIPEDRVAWHAGKGEYGGDERYTNAMNKYAIGIELVGIGSERDMAAYLTADEYAALDSELVGFTDSQYTALRELVFDISGRNGIALDREHIIGHSDYSKTRTDPGELFDFDRVLAE